MSYIRLCLTVEQSIVLPLYQLDSPGAGDPGYDDRPYHFLQLSGPRKIFVRIPDSVRRGGQFVLPWGGCAELIVLLLGEKNSHGTPFSFFESRLLFGTAAYW